MKRISKIIQIRIHQLRTIAEKFQVEWMIRTATFGIKIMRKKIFLRKNSRLNLLGGLGYDAFMIMK